MKRGSLRRFTPLKRGKWNRRSKFHAKPVFDGHTLWDSKAEARDGWNFELLQRAGHISNLKTHQKVVLVPANGKAQEIAWNIDFVFTDRGRTVYVDSKRRPIQRHERLLMRLWHHFGPGLLRIMQDHGKTTEIMPVANEREGARGRRTQSNASDTVPPPTRSSLSQGEQENEPDREGPCSRGMLTPASLGSDPVHLPRRQQ